MVKPPPPGTNVLYFEKHLAERILSAMRIRQSSMVLYVFSCERPEELSWSPKKPPSHDDHDDALWFPVDRCRQHGPQEEEQEQSSSCLIPTSKYGGFVLHKRFQPLLLWIRGQGLGFYLSRQKALVCYWHPGTASEQNGMEKVLYNHYLQRLTRECDAQYIEDVRARIKRAMDAGQTMASVQILYAGGFSRKTPETITEICLICHETKQVLTNATLDRDDLRRQWVVHARYKPLIEALDKDGLRWSLRFEDVDKYDWALMVASWV
jgi:hypothetical protein